MRQKAVLSVLTAGTVVLAAAACSSGGSAGSGQTNTFILAALGGSNQSALVTACLDPFAKAHNLTPEAVSDSSTSELQIQEQTHKVSWNVALDAINGPGAGNWGSLLDPINYSIVKTSDMLPQYRQFATKYGVGHDIYATVIAYNTKDLTGSKVPTDWADFFNAKKFPGERGVASVAYNGPDGLIEELELGAGRSPGDLYPMDLPLVTNMLNGIKSDLVLYTSQAQAEANLASGRVVMTDIVASHAYEMQAEGDPVGVVWNQNLSGADVLEVPKNAPDYTLDMEFIQYCNTAGPQEIYSKLHPNGPVNAVAATALPAKLSEELPTAADHLSVAVQTSATYWTDANATAATNALLAWQAG
jgi:putative spermidine/putrescine transport system substrate-binding protein